MHAGVGASGHYQRDRLLHHQLQHALQLALYALPVGLPLEAAKPGAVVGDDEGNVAPAV
jgi:hypothetical protein